MTVKSPIDGIVYYGKSTRGRFSDSTSLAENLRYGGIIQPNHVVMTVVDPRPMVIRASGGGRSTALAPPRTGRRGHARRPIPS